MILNQSFAIINVLFLNNSLILLRSACSTCPLWSTILVLNHDNLTFTFELSAGLVKKRHQFVLIAQAIIIWTFKNYFCSLNWVRLPSNNSIHFKISPHLNESSKLEDI